MDGGGVTWRSPDDTVVVADSRYHTIRRCFRRRGVDFFSMFGGQKISPFHFLSLVFSAGRGGVPAEIGLKFSPPKFRIYLDQI